MRPRTPPGVRGRVECEVREVLHEHRRALEQRTVRVHHEGAAIEDEVVLAAHLVHVDHRRMHFGGAPAGQVEPGLGLAFLVRRPVDRQQHVDVLRGELGDRAAVLPDVLADCQPHAHTVDRKHDVPLTGGENAEFVEHAVIGQEVLVVPGPHQAAVQHHESVARLAVGVVGADGAHHHVQASHAFAFELCGQFVGFVPCGFTECGTQGQVFDRVAGQGHLREDDDVGALTRHAGGCHDFGGVAVQVAHAGVDLRKRETCCAHAPLVYPLTTRYAFRMIHRAPLTRRASSTSSAEFA